MRTVRVRMLFLWAAMWVGVSQTGATSLAPVTPADLHRELAAAKAQRLDQLRSPMPAGVASLGPSPYDVTYYDLHISLSVVTKSLTGHVSMEARCLEDGLSQFDLDLYLSLSADSVRMNGTPVAYTHLGSKVYITPPTTLDSGEVFAVSVYYSGNPTAGGFGAFGFHTHGDPPEPIVWSLSEPYFANHWWPCKDTPADKADSADIHITCPSDLTAASVGTLESNVLNPDGTRTMHWRHRHPIATYLISLAVSNFTRLDYAYVHAGGSDTMPVQFWVYPEKVSAAKASYPEILTMLDAFAEIYGPYPFLDEKYGISHFAWGGGMEHQTNSSQSSMWYSWALNAHELAHQWWGDMVTCRTWNHIWLNEGFASWSEAFYREWLAGKGAYHDYMAGMAYRGAGTIYVPDTTNVSRIFHGGLSYDKGAWVVHMLRHVLGDEAFFAALVAYRNEYAGSSATTEDFQSVCEETSGLDLEEFFSDWIYGQLFPRYAYGFYSVPEDNAYRVYVRLEQLQSSAPQVFDMPVDLRFTDGVRDTLLIVHNDQRIQWFDLLLDRNPRSMDVDPDAWILCYTYPGVAILSNQLKSGPRDEFYADTLVAVRGTPPYSWTLEPGSIIPHGLALSSDGVISGVPATMGEYTFTVRAASAGSPQTSMERVISMTIGFPLRPPGDVTNDGQLSASDVIFLVNYVFKGGQAPEPLTYGDVDLSCSITAQDIIHLVNYLFKSGPVPLDGCAT